MGNKSSRTEGVSQPGIPPLLHVPIDVVRLVADHLNPPSVTALAVTCVAMYRIFGTRSTKLGARDRCHYLDLLERDLCRKYFHCVSCSKLHPYSPKLTSRDPVIPFTSSPVNSLSTVCLGTYGTAFNPNGVDSPTYISEAFVRLLMNRHRYGAPCGLPLDSLAKTIWVPTANEKLAWRQDFSAAIISDELYIRVEHTIEGRSNTLCRAINDGRYWICPHISTFSLTDVSRGIVHRHPELQAHIYGGKVRPFKGSLKSCRFCLTDMIMDVEKTVVRHKTVITSNPSWVHRGRKVDGYRLKIKSWHRLGGCLDPGDYRWRVLVNGMLASFLRPSVIRNFSGCPPGFIKVMWESFEEAS